jgi:hypothetical protein
LQEEGINGRAQDKEAKFKKEESSLEAKESRETMAR